MSNQDDPPPNPAAEPPADAGPDAPREADPFAAAFQGPEWNSGSSRRRRSSSSGQGTRSRSGSSRRRPGRRSPSPARPPEPSPKQGRRGRTPRSVKVRSLVVHGVIGVLGLGLVWVVVTGALAAWQLNQARADLTSVRSALSSGSSASLESSGASLVTHAHRAQVLTSGPAWAIASALPFVGSPLESVRGIARETSTLVQTATPGVVAVADEIDPRSTVKGDTVDLAAVRAAAPAVHTAAEAAASARAGIGALPSSTWLSPVDRATTTLRDELTSLTGTLQATDRAFQVLPTMLGGDGVTRRYFVAFQNNAELRGTGGLPGAFAIVTATNGSIGVERFESDQLLLSGPVLGGLDFGTAYDAHWGPSAESIYVSSNQSPHFPYAGQLWQSMWQQISGQRVDGALTVDPGALSYLLAATGPTTAPDGETVSAANVVKLLQVDAYTKFPAAGENNDRKDYILGIAEAAEKKILSGTGNSRALLQGLVRSVDERRVVAWSSDPAVQAVLAESTIGGTVPRTVEPFSQLVVNNGNGGKLDYYLGRSVTVQRSGCGDTRDVTVTVKLTNNAPTSGLPPYVTDRVGVPAPPGYVVGQNREVVDYVATTGAQLLGTSVDGQTGTAAIYDEEGHPSFQVYLEIPPGRTVTWVLRLQEPAGSQPFTVQKQPGVTPVDVTVDDRGCS